MSPYRISRPTLALIRISKAVERFWRWLVGPAQPPHPLRRSSDRVLTADQLALRKALHEWEMIAAEKRREHAGRAHLRRVS